MTASAKACASIRNIGSRSRCCAIASPGLNSFGDLDLPSPGQIERNGFVCQIDLKSPGKDLEVGQRIVYANVTLQQRRDGIPGNLVVIFEDDGPTMRVDRFTIFWEGREYDFETGPLERLKTRLRRWETYTQRQPKLENPNRTILPASAIPEFLQLDDDQSWWPDWLRDQEIISPYDHKPLFQLNGRKA